LARNLPSEEKVLLYLLIRREHLFWMILRCYLPPVNDKVSSFDWGSCDNENGEQDALAAKIAAFRDVYFWAGF
jgi:hypothetical protein